MMKPSVIAVSSAKKRAKAMGKTSTSINMMDVLKIIDVMAKRIEELEKEVEKNRNY